jgi:peptide/nickel transport system ATP-binding protein
MREAPILKAEGLSRYFPVRNAFGIKTGAVRALDGVSFEVQLGETLGIVGESGCGKSTLGKALAGIHALSGGAIEFEGEQISQLSVRERRAVAPRLQYCHQDPGNSLDPRWTIRRSLEEPLIVHTRLKAAERVNRIRDLLRQVGLPQTHLDLYPHELSGGQQRRVGLARILALHPRLVVLDEPTSGLDMSVQATVLKLFSELREAFALTYLFISHDLSVVRMMCDRVAAAQRLPLPHPMSARRCDLRRDRPCFAPAAPQPRGSLPARGIVRAGFRATPPAPACEWPWRRGIDTSARRSACPERARRGRESD